MSETNLADDAPPKAAKREIFGWLMYDWANSAYYTTVIGVLIAPYLTALAQAHVGENGVVFDLGFLGNVTAKSLTSLTTVIGVIIQAFLMIFLSAIADYSGAKKLFMMVLCYVGVTAGGCLFFVEGTNYLFGCFLLIVSNVCIGASLVFYNSFLNDIAPPEERDKISARGYAFGYIGGSVMLILNLLLLKNAENLGTTQGLAVRISILSAVIWWGGFALVTFKLLKSHHEKKDLPADENIFSIALRELRQTFRQFIKLRYTLLFLIAYLFYNDGIQTVIYQASVFVEQELFIAKGLPADRSFLFLLFLEVQIVAFIGALFWERLSRLIGTKATILATLAWWSGVVIYAYQFLTDKSEAWYLGAAIGFVLGGTQSLSRSLYSKMIPEGREASFFSFYEISEKGTSWMGLLVFSIIVSSTGSYRQAILALIFFFVVGGLLLALTKIERAISDAHSIQ